MIPWLTRALYAVLRGPGLSRSALKRVLNLLQTHDIHSRQFWLGVESYLRNHCDHFIHEFYNFARSPYDMIGFDENAVYSGRSMIQVRIVLLRHCCVCYICMSLCFLLFESELRIKVSFLDL